MKRIAQGLGGQMGMGRAAHENIEGGKTMFGPSMHRNMAFRQNGDAGHAPLGRKMMQVQMQQGRLGGPHRSAHGLAKDLGIVQMARAPHIQQQMGARERHAILDFEMVVGGQIFIGRIRRPWAGRR